MNERFHAWHKSTRSSGGGNCVEVSISDSGNAVGVRDSKDRDGATLIFPTSVFKEFLDSVRDGEFDLP